MDSNSKQAPYVIVVGVDYSGVSHFALCEALRLAGERPLAELHVVHVDAVLEPNPLSKRSLDEERGQALERLDRFVAGELEIARTRASPSDALASLRIVTHLRTHHAGKEVAQLALDLEADLVIVGTHGRTGISRLLLGSVAHAIVTFAPCTVLVVRPMDAWREGGPLQPPCAACALARQRSGRSELWCDVHREGDEPHTLERTRSPAKRRSFAHAQIQHRPSVTHERPK